MITTTDSSIKTLTSPISEVHIKLELMDHSENILDVFTHHVNSDTIGDISVNADRDIRRMFTLTLDNRDGKFTWNEDSLIWIDNKKIKL
ncbi:hypothetical protein [Crassaminicella profunda]|uniref:hypothetical protein n=1 Tax=Crassaminicella profunda TaxID=1286698 RepID=UPI001CA778A6|nr:hypothetical protein [Crassaminicella profunda]QZY57170.1 hypothetical protein K7H06_09725 [Crassaminicella profunda]